VLDVTDAAAVCAVRDQIHRDGGSVDIVVNNAGTVFGGSFLDVPLEKHLLTYRVNTLGLVAVTHAFLPDLIGRPESNLVNIASASGFVGLPFGTTYASSKWAVIGLSEGLRLELKELGHRHVAVTAVCPSYVKTGLFDGVTLPTNTDWLTAERLAELVVRGIERNKPYVLAPWLVHLTPFLKGILPLSVMDWVGNYFGINTTMYSWRGHGGSSLPAPHSSPNHEQARGNSHVA
jgi:short-subunit dehydrogenase